MNTIDILMITLCIELVLFMLLLLAAPYMLWSDFAAVMSFRRCLDAGTLTPEAEFLGRYIVIRAFILDYLVNSTWMWLLLWEKPQERTVTARINRHVSGSTGFRYERCLYIRTKYLDNIDSRGIHNS